MDRTLMPDQSPAVERLHNMKFAKKTFGGVSEEDVWRQISLLDKDYQNAYAAQASLCEQMLAQRDVLVARLAREVERLGGDPTAIMGMCGSGGIGAEGVRDNLSNMQAAVDLRRERRAVARPAARRESPEPSGRSPGGGSHVKRARP